MLVPVAQLDFYRFTNFLHISKWLHLLYWPCSSEILLVAWHFRSLCLQTDGTVHEATDKIWLINFLCFHQKFIFIPACTYLIMNFRFTSAFSQIKLNLFSSVISCSCYSYSSYFPWQHIKKQLSPSYIPKFSLEACFSFFSLQGIKLDNQLWYPLYSLSQDRKVLSSIIHHWKY